ncbi:MAG: 2-dehydropantoate 2-reductase [Subtercola sp.]|nr:2-dehydropantoate 2-reductase [Subtercola sp.]
MRILIYGAGVIGSIYSARLHDAGHDVSLLARGDRLAALRQHGLLLAEGDSPIIRRVPVPVVDRPTGRYDLTLVFVRTHQIDGVLESIAEHAGAGAGAGASTSGSGSTSGSDGPGGDVLFLLNWAAGPDPLAAVIGRERVLLGFPTLGGTTDDDVVRYRPTSLLTRLISMPIGEPDGRTTPRVSRIVTLFRHAGISAKPEPRMDAWLRTHAAFEVPLGQAVHAAGGLEPLAGDAAAIRAMVQRMRVNLGSLPTRPVPRTFNALRTVPEGILVPVFRRFLRSNAAAPLSTASPAVFAELDRLIEQLGAIHLPPTDADSSTSTTSGKN